MVDSFSSGFTAVFICRCVIISADREVQRILLELLNQMDGFDQTVNVKVGHQNIQIT